MRLPPASEVFMAAPNEPAIERAELSTTDPDVAHDFLRSVYVDHEPELSGDRERFEFRAELVREERFGIEFVEHSMELHTLAGPYRALQVPHVLSGRLHVAGEGTGVHAHKGDH